jgi:hypothetical protein
MFTWMNKQDVRSTEGFEVQRTGRFTAEYREGSRRLVVYVEGGSNGFVNFNRRCFERWGNSSMRNSEQEQERMIKNFLAALEFQGLKGLP